MITDIQFIHIWLWMLEFRFLCMCIVQCAMCINVKIFFYITSRLVIFWSVHDHCISILTFMYFAMFVKNAAGLYLVCWYSWLFNGYKCLILYLFVMKFQSSSEFMNANLRSSWWLVFLEILTRQQANDCTNWNKYLIQLN